MARRLGITLGENAAGAAETRPSPEGLGLELEWVYCLSSVPGRFKSPRWRWHDHRKLGERWPGRSIARPLRPFSNYHLEGASIGGRLLGHPEAVRADRQARRGVGLPICHAGRVDIVFPPQLLHRRRWPAFGTVTASGRASTLTSALWPQASQAALTARTPFARMFARVMGGPGLLRMVQVESRRIARARF